MKGTTLLLLSVVLLLAALHLLMPIGSLVAARRADPDLMRLILVELRLPRTLLALGYGFTLGVCGAAVQALFANPLASPDITGTSSTAALGTVAGTYWLGIGAPFAIALCGAAGALLGLFLLLLIAGSRASSTRFLLAGIAITMAAGAATSLLLALAPSPFAFYDSFDWLMGRFADHSLEQAATALIPAAIASLLLLRRTSDYDWLALGEDVTAAGGLDPRRLARETVALTAIAVGACVSVCGAVGFIGLMAPIVARRWTGGHPGRALLPAGILGAILLMLADGLSRLAPDGRSLPVGVLTALAGTPLLIAMLVRPRGGLQ